MYVVWESSYRATGAYAFAWRERYQTFMICSFLSYVAFYSPCSYPLSVIDSVIFILRHLEGASYGAYSGVFEEICLVEICVAMVSCCIKWLWHSKGAHSLYCIETKRKGKSPSYTTLRKNRYRERRLSWLCWNTIKWMKMKN